MDDVAIGIDLGTTNSCVSYYANGELKIVENIEGGRITPSVVFFTEKKGTIVGEYAKKLATAKPEYAVYEIKRLVGRKTDDPDVQNNLKYFPFKLDGASNDPVVLIEHTNNTLKKSALDICAALLKKIKTDVENKIAHSAEKAVITVPAYFNINQREVTLAAANKAGFTVLKLLNEPTAAALNYYWENEFESGNHSLVYDLGGGTFDVAILKKNFTNIETICVDGDSHLGGQDFDNLIIDYVCDELQGRYTYNPRTDRRCMRRLQNHCEEAKKTLSVADETTILLDGFIENVAHAEIFLTRSQFEAMAENLFRKTIRVVDDCLKNSNLPKSAIKEVILSGGSTRIPKIQEMLSSYFDGKTLNKFVNPDECVAKGAALQAAMLTANPLQKIDQIKITDVTPLSLGVGSFVNLMSFLIKRNTPIPVSVKSTRASVYDQQKSMTFGIYEGERLDVRKNRCLSKLTIGDITPAPPGQCAVILTMNIDNNGILTISAKEKYKDNFKDLKVTYTRGQRSDSEVKNALKDAEDHSREDLEFKIFATYKEYLVMYCISAIHHFEQKHLVQSYKESYDLCKKIEQQASNMNFEDEDVLNIKKMIEEVKSNCETIVKKYNFELMPTMRM